MRHGKKESQKEERNIKHHNGYEGAKKISGNRLGQGVYEQRPKQIDGDEKLRSKAERKGSPHTNKDVKKANRRVSEVNEEDRKVVFAQADKRMMSMTLVGKYTETEDESLRLKLEEFNKIRSEESRRIKAMKRKQSTTLFGAENSATIQKMESKLKNFHKRVERSKSRKNSKGKKDTDSKYTALPF